MNRFFFFICLSFFICFTAQAQIIQFSDTALKRYLVTENCVDTTHNGLSFSRDISVDQNADGEVDMNEALAVTSLEFMLFVENYEIYSISDVSVFSNLEELKVLFIDSLKRIENLGLNKLKKLHLSDCFQLTYLDISDLTNLTEELRIEGMTKIDSMNIRNGVLPTQFSLFYTQNVKWACVDSIKAEFDAFYDYGAMDFGLTPTINCEMLVGFKVKSDIAASISVFPNPTINFLNIESNEPLGQIKVYNWLGSLVHVVFVEENSLRLDVSHLESGLYLIRIQDEYRRILIGDW